MCNVECKECGNNTAMCRDPDMAVMCVCGHCYGCHNGANCPRCNLKGCFGREEMFLTMDDFWRELDA